MIAVTFYQQLQAVCFDEEFARVRGLNTGFFYTLLLVLIAFTVVLLISVVGMVLVVALLTLPAAAAGPFVRSLRQMMVLSTILCLWGGGTEKARHGPSGHLHHETDKLGTVRRESDPSARTSTHSTPSASGPWITVAGAFAGHQGLKVVGKENVIADTVDFVDPILYLSARATAES